MLSPTVVANMFFLPRHLLPMGDQIARKQTLVNSYADAYREQIHRIRERENKIFESVKLSTTASISWLQNGYGLKRSTAWFRMRSSNTVRHRWLSLRSTPSWKGVGDNSWKISLVCIVITSETPRGVEFRGAQRSLWSHSVDYTNRRGETCYLPEKL